MLIVSATTALNAWLMQPVLDEIFLKKNEKMLYIIPVVVVVLALVKGLATFYQQTSMKKMGQKILTEIQLKLYSCHLYTSRCV